MKINKRDLIFRKYKALKARWREDETEIRIAGVNALRHLHKLVKTFGIPDVVIGLGVDGLWYDIDMSIETLK